MREFISQLVEEAGFGSMPEDFKAEYEERLLIEAHKRLGLAAMAKLKPAQIRQFEKLREAGDAAAADRFLGENISGFSDKMGQVLAEFRESVLAKAAQFKK